MLKYTKLFVVYMLTFFIVIFCTSCNSMPLITFKNRELVNSEAIENSKKLFEFLNINYGNRILSGQNVANNEIEEIFNVTGKYPAICSFDLRTLSSLHCKYDTSGKELLLQRVIDWAKNGGIVAMQWHWLSPSGEVNNSDHPWYKSFYTNATTFDVSKIFDSSSIQYKQIIDDLDLIADFLLELQTFNIPILWRPLHEASGKWFWWGAQGKEAYKKLWQIMFDRFTNLHKLNNLIWVWNGQSKDWYVGNNFADIVSFDVYENSTSNFLNKSKQQFKYGRKITNDAKILALSECRTLPSISDVENNKACWSWFAIWCYEYILKDGKYSEEYTSKQLLKEVYSHETVITRDELEFVLYNDIVR